MRPRECSDEGIVLSVLILLCDKLTFCMLQAAHLPPNKIKQGFASVFLSSLGQGPYVFSWISP